MAADSDLETFKEIVKQSFLKVKNDMQEIKLKIEELAQDSLHLKQRVSEFETELEEQKRYQESNSSIVSPPETEGSQYLRLNQSPQETEGSQRLRQHEDLRPFEQEFLKQLNKNKKQVIQNHIMSMLQERSMSPWELKEIIVDRSKYCSKASFYRYLKELVYTGVVHEITENGTTTLRISDINL